MVESVLARLDPGQIVPEPYPHLVAHRALDPAYYAELEASYPEIEAIAGQGPLISNKRYDRSAFDVQADSTIPQIWRDFFAYHSSQAFLTDILRFWGGAIVQAYPDLEMRFGKPLAQLTAGVRQPGRQSAPENLQADVMLDCQFGVNSPVTTVSSVRVPHVDNPLKLFVGLLYFRRSDDRSTGGDLNLYRLKGRRYYHDKKLNVPERFIETVSQVPYQANTLVMFLNTERSLHGVTPRSITEVPRRFVNLVGECYQLQKGGLFTRRQSPWDKGLDAFRHLLVRK